VSHLVISQTWLFDTDEAFEAYLALVDEYDDFLRRQPGFISRRLVRSIEEPNHVIHLREFDTVGDYEAMTRIPEYQTQIAALSEFVDPAAYPPGAVPREYGEITFDSP